MAVITWLDQSAEQNRRVNELVRLFSDTESRDELGIGQIRDVISDVLFPGTSVVQTRARYAVLVPWLFQHRSRRGLSGDRLLDRVRRDERILIETLRDAGAERGLIGRDAGINLQRLPSAIYWNALSTWGILRRPVGPNSLGFDDEYGNESDELVDRHVGDWAVLPPAPDGFPGVVPGGLELSAPEADWLAERIVTSHPDSLLTHLIAAEDAPTEEARFVWEDPSAMGARTDAKQWLADAQQFSEAMHGAALLYNLLVAEAYEAAGYSTQQVGTPEGYREELEDWQDLIAATSALTTWDFSAFRNAVATENGRISPLTWSFIASWVDIARTGRSVADDRSARQLVDHRERSRKQGQSRLASKTHLARWSGESGRGQLRFRWPTVKDIVTDIHNGRRADDAGS